jgi:hypothetical protein
MKLVFVYNADSDPVSGLFDIGHKLFSPETYQCGLCSLTHDTFSEKQAWKSFREESAVDMEFLHRDEFEKKYGVSHEYPVVLRSNGELDLVLSKNDIDAIGSVEELIGKIRSLVS